MMMTLVSVTTMHALMNKINNYLKNVEKPLTYEEYDYYFINNIVLAEFFLKHVGDKCYLNCFYKFQI